MSIAARRTFLACLSLLALLVMSATPAMAKSAPVTKLGFKLADHHVVVGETVEIVVTVRTRSGHAWVGVPGAPVNITVDGNDIGMGVTDDTGTATVSWIAAPEGGHVMKVSYAGDDLHKRAKRAQGFHVDAAPAPEPAV